MGLSLVHPSSPNGQELSFSEGPENYEVDALQCWRRLSTNAPRVGETFEMWVTCRIVETEIDRVSSDFVTLQAESIEVSPFEIVSGERSRDVREGIVSFLQFVYELRLSPGNYFGIDLPLPQLEIMYRIERRVEEGLFIPGRQLRHVIPEEPIHILSVVSGDADGLRPLEGETFDSANETQFLADGLLMLSILLALFAVGFGILTIILGVRLRKEKRPQKSINLSPGFLIFSLFFELRGIRSEIDRIGWNEELVDRALSAIRITGSVISENKIAVRDGQDKGFRQSGEMLVRMGMFRNRKYFVSASGARFKRGSDLDEQKNSLKTDVLSERLTGLLSRFTRVRYSRESEVFPSDLTETLEDVQSFLFKVARRQLSVNQWILKRFQTGIQAF
tara:strand:+ start:937 stop:2109 length:1173 start_codon:yes stop_codon:yes gene_type:complete